MPSIKVVKEHMPGTDLMKYCIPKLKYHLELELLGVELNWKLLYVRMYVQPRHEEGTLCRESNVPPA